VSRTTKDPAVKGIVANVASIHPRRTDSLDSLVTVMPLSLAASMLMFGAYQLHRWAASSLTSSNRHHFSLPAIRTQESCARLRALQMLGLGLALLVTGIVDGADWIGRPWAFVLSVTTASNISCKFLVNNFRIFMPVINTDIHLPERAQSSKNAAADPRAIQPLRRGEDLDPHVLNCEPLDLVQ